MYQCEAIGVPCLSNDYNKFDNIARLELSKPISVDTIINQSGFCTFLSIDFIEQTKSDDGFLNLNQHLTSLKNKVGIYHMWVDYDYCQDHEIYSMLCVYVGKGFSKNRILTHIKEKWPTQELLYISFYECENRIAKYLEQLFLDTYKFHLNNDEMAGNGYLYAKNGMNFDIIWEQKHK